MMKRNVVIALALSFLLALFGCGKDDGPGMVNDQPWTAFTLSRSDSFNQRNFWFTVERTDEGHLLTGECQDKDGSEHTQEEGVPLSSEDVLFIRELRLADLTDVVSDEGEEDAPFALDAPEITLVLTYLDGTTQEKALPSDQSIQIYEHFLPYFQKNKE